MARSAARSTPLAPGAMDDDKMVKLMGTAPLFAATYLVPILETPLQIGTSPFEH